MRYATPSVFYTLDKRKPKKNTSPPKYPLKLRVVRARDNRYYQLDKDFYLTDEEFKKLDTSRLPNMLEAKHEAIKKLAEANKIIRELGEYFTFDDFKRIYESSTKSSKDFYSVYEEYIKNLEDHNHHSTARGYKDGLKSLRNHRKNLYFRDITPEFLQKYAKSFERKIIPGNYLRCMRAVYNYGVNVKRIISKDYYPFGRHGYKVPNEKRRNIALDDKILKQLYEYHQKHCSVSVNKKIQAIDMFLFSYLCNGMNFSDIAQLRYSDIKTDEQGNKYINYLRGKTAESTHNTRYVYIYFNKLSFDIFQRHSNPYGSGDDYIFPFISSDMTSQKISQRIENQRKAISKKLGNEIAKDLDIPKFSFDYARHSFSTSLRNKGYDYSDIRDLLGHSVDITEGYIDSRKLKLYKKASKDILKTLTK